MRLVHILEIAEAELAAQLIAMDAIAIIVPLFPSLLCAAIRLGYFPELDFLLMH